MALRTCLEGKCADPSAIGFDWTSSRRRLSAISISAFFVVDVITVMCGCSFVPRLRYMVACSSTSGGMTLLEISALVVVIRACDGAAVVVVVVVTVGVVVDVVAMGR